MTRLTLHVLAANRLNFRNVRGQFDHYKKTLERAMAEEGRATLTRAAKILDEKSEATRAASAARIAAVNRLEAGMDETVLRPRTGVLKRAILNPANRVVRADSRSTSLGLFDEKYMDTTRAARYWRAVERGTDRNIGRYLTTTATQRFSTAGGGPGGGRYRIRRPVPAHQYIEEAIGPDRRGIKKTIEDAVRSSFPGWRWGRSTL